MDEIYVVAEQLLPVFTETLAAVMHEAGLNPNEKGAMIIASLKDPIWVHEKAVDDYAKRFQDELPEACVMDLIGTRVVCSDADKMEKLVSCLRKGLSTSTPEARPEMVRCKNNFSDKDPTHFRNIMANMRMVCAPLAVFVEVQIHHKDILEYNEHCHAHDRNAL